MTKTKLLIAAAALATSSAAVAMPEQVPAGWYDRMIYRLQIMAENNGFCRNHATSWVCGD